MLLSCRGRRFCTFRMRGFSLSQLKWLACYGLSRLHTWTPFGLSSCGCSASLGLGLPVLTLSLTMAIDVSRAPEKSVTDFL